MILFGRMKLFTIGKYLSKIDQRIFAQIVTVNYFGRKGSSQLLESGYY